MFGRKKGIFSAALFPSNFIVHLQLFKRHPGLSSLLLNNNRGVSKAFKSVCDNRVNSRPSIPSSLLSGSQGIWFVDTQWTRTFHQLLSERFSPFGKHQENFLRKIWRLH